MANYDIAENMSAQQMITQIEMAIGDRNRTDLEWMLDEYGPKIRASVGEREWRDLERRATDNSVATNGSMGKNWATKRDYANWVKDFEKMWDKVFDYTDAFLDNGLTQANSEKAAILGSISKIVSALRKAAQTAPEKGKWD